MSTAPPVLHHTFFPNVDTTLLRAVSLTLLFPEAYNEDFDIKIPLLLKHAIIWLEDHIFCIISTSYSYWCHHLNLTIHRCQVVLPLLPFRDRYFHSEGFPLCTTGPTISRLPYRHPLEMRSSFKVKWTTLSRLPGLFNDIRLPIYLLTFTSVTRRLHMFHVQHKYFKGYVFSGFPF